MAPNEYKELFELIGARFDRVDRRLASMEDRMTRIEHWLTRIEDLLTRAQGRLTCLEAGDALASRLGTQETTVATRFGDHERRIVSLE